MKSFFPKPTFKVDDIISYAELVAAENANIGFLGLKGKLL
jgi:hypothetical protein